MKKNPIKTILPLALAVILILGLAAWAILGSLNKDAGESTSTVQSGDGTGTANVSTDGAIDASTLFSDRDLRQTAELTEAVNYTVSDGSDITISAAGVYVLTGSAKNVTVYVETGSNDKVQLVLDGLELVNDDFPAIYVKKTDKVFITTAENSENSLSVTGSFRADGTTNTDGVIFSRDDLVFNGLGSLRIESSDNGVCGKDSVKVTGGTITVSAADCALEANDLFAMSDGTVTLSATNDGLHVENDDEDAKGHVYIGGGSLSISVKDDGVHALSIVQIDGGSLDITAAEGIEGTWIQINDGTINISATDDGINGANKSSAFSARVELNGGTVSVNMGPGDTDGIDSNGDLLITGGTISVNAQSAFDWDGTLTWTGGAVSVNGTEVTEITNQFGATGGFGGPGGGRGGWGGRP